MPSEGVVLSRDVRDAATVEAELARARAQQAAVAAVMRTMSAAPTDLDATLDAILTAATQLCHAAQGYIYVLDGDVYRITRTVGIDMAFDRWAREHPVPVGDPGKATSRAALLGGPLHIPDVLKDPQYTFTEAQQRGNFRTILSVPLMKDGVAVAVISMWRTVQRPFTDEEIVLVTTFADQALVAFESVRLAQETRETLARQTAISEILRGIAASPSDQQPVLDTIARSAVRFCGAEDAAVALRAETTYRFVAHEGDLLPVGNDWPLDESTVSGRVIIRGELVSVAGLQELADEFPRSAESAKRSGLRAMASAPMLREGRAIGAIVLRRREAKAFTAAEIDLLRAFADQAVIAIENVRLFNETKESLEQQRAIAEILRVISESPTDIQPVLDAIARSATRYCGAEDYGVALVRADGLLEQVAQHGPISRSLAPWTVDRGSVRGRAVVERRVVHVEVMLAEAPGEYPIGQQRARDLGQRTILAAPLLRKGVALGAIALRRTEIKTFSERP